ncbi:MAG: TrlF family AAA-like ATPase [Candidatus Dojkabacteria bacterium]
MDSKYLKRGSEWRKWDLHIHTPASFQWNGGKLLRNMDSLETEESMQKFISVINDSSTEAFCVMDYWTFDWVIALKKYTKLHPDELKKRVFYGIELRVESSTDYRLNIHAILSDELSVQQLNDFKSSLKVRIGNTLKSLSEEALVQFALQLDESNARDHGYENPDILSEESLWELGSKTSIITRDSLTDAVKALPKGKAYILMPYDTSDGLLRLDWSSYPSDDIYFMRTAAIFEARDQRNIDLFNGNKTEENKQFYKNFFKTIGNIPKPCVSGSDAHSFSDYGKCPDNKFTWIKADTTFEGFKQILYEPIDRIKIQELIPENKGDYLVIDNVNFIDDGFSPEKIFLSQNLTTIIGGKSTGKSLLLRNIAQTIDPEQVKSRIEEVDLKEYSKEISDFRATWKDAQEFKKNEVSSVAKKIIYLPQSYLNRITDKKEGKAAIEEIIKKVLSQGVDTQKSFDQLEELQRTNEKQISTSIENLFFTRQDIISKSESIKEIGDKAGIENEIKKLSEIVATLKATSGLNPEEIEEYNSQISQYKELRTQYENINRDKIVVERIKTNLVINPLDLSLLSQKAKDKLQEKVDTIEKFYLESIELLISEYIKELKDESTNLKRKLEKLHQLLAPIQLKLQESKALDDNIKNLENEETKLKKINEEELLLNKKKDEYMKLQEEIVKLHNNFYENIFNAKTEILKQKEISKPLSFDISIDFNKDSFKKDFIEEVCDLRKLGQFEDGLLQKYCSGDSSEFKSDIKKMVSGILNGKLSLKVNYTKQEAIRKLLQNWSTFNYQITQDGDELSNMSPGKKSFVILKLLIELDNSKCPILLDQPEDDLDNRSVYDDLVQFIKNKKKERQIVIATHNPNLVVGADAECVIVANQDGEKMKNETYQFEYVSGALEDTFVDKDIKLVLYHQGIQEHVCDVLEGGKVAFENRKNKYNLN